MRLFAVTLSKLQLIFLISTLTTSSAFAGAPQGGTITFGLASLAVDPTAVPTLSGTMLIVLSLLLFLVAFKVTKQKNSNASKFFIMMLGVSALGFGGSGIKLVNDAKASANIPAVLDEEGMEFEGTNHLYINNFIDPPQNIKVISVNPGVNTICEIVTISDPDPDPEGEGGERKSSLSRDVIPQLNCLDLPTLVPGQVCELTCRARTVND